MIFESYKMHGHERLIPLSWYNAFDQLDLTTQGWSSYVMNCLLMTIISINTQDMSNFLVYLTQMLIFMKNILAFKSRCVDKQFQRNIYIIYNCLINQRVNLLNINIIANAVCKYNDIAPVNVVNSPLHITECNSEGNFRVLTLKWMRGSISLEESALVVNIPYHFLIGRYPWDGLWNWLSVFVEWGRDAGRELTFWL